MNSTPVFSVIIPTYHRNDLLAKCLDCLAPGVQTLPAEQYEVIVTDDGSQTTAEEIIRENYPWAQWVAGPRKGPAANRNNGAKYAQGEWLAFTDDDCLPDRKWLKAYAEAMVTNPSCLVLEGRTYVDRPKQSLAEESPINETGGYLWSCNFAIQKRVFKSLSGFDERFPYAAMEDVDLRLRITKFGHQFYFIKEASVCHPWRVKGGYKKITQNHKSTLIYLSIHPKEFEKINYKYYSLVIIKGLIKETIPGLFKYKLLGLQQVIIEYIGFLIMVFIMYFQEIHYKNQFKFFKRS